MMVGAVAGVGLWGCQHAATTNPPAREGRSTFEFVTPPPAPETKDMKAEVGGEPLAKHLFFAPRPEGTLAVPVYPAEALAAREGPVTIGMRIVVGVDGRVNEVGPSLLIFSTPTPLGAEFRAAVEAAVTQWKFHPGEIRHFATVTNREGSYRSMTSSEKTEWALHVAFAFSSTGEVLTTTVKTGAK